MKNFEKYEKEIKEKMCDRYKGLRCLEDVVDKRFDYTYDVISWLYEDYKEPLLTDEEREYLKAVIKPFRDEVREIYKTKIIKTYYLTINRRKNGEILVDLSIPTTIFEFKGIDEYKAYSLEELGL